MARAAFFVHDQGPKRPSAYAGKREQNYTEEKKEKGENQTKISVSAFIDAGRRC